MSEALDRGPELGQYEARLAHARLALAAGQPRADDVVRDTLRRARVGGHHVSVQAPAGGA